MPPGEFDSLPIQLEYEPADKRQSQREKTLSTVIVYGAMVLVFIPLMVLLSLAVEREEKDALLIWLRVPTLIIGVAASMLLYAAVVRLLFRTLNVNR